MIGRLLSYPRSLVMAIVYPPYLIAASIISILANLIFNDPKIDSGILRVWGRLSCTMFGVKIRVEGIENLPQEGGVVLFNHSSFFDIFALAAGVPDIRFGAKIELFKIPFFGFAMRRIGTLPIARQRREEVFKIYEEAESRLRAGQKFALAPEGTRQNEEKLGSFKSGPFIFAINAGAPLIPVVIRNAAGILPKHHLLPNTGVWTREIVLRVLPPVETKGFVLDQRPVVQERVRSRMGEHLPLA